MVQENIAYPAVLEWVAHVLLFIPDLDENTALETLNQLITINESEATSDISSMTIYYAFFRENHTARFGPFKSDKVREFLKDQLSNGGLHFKATAAHHFANLLD